MLSQTEALIIPHILREPNSIIVLLFFENIQKFKLSLNACFVSKKTQAANNGTAWNCSETLISQSDYEKNILKTIVRLQGDEISHNVVCLFLTYDEMSHNVVYLFSTLNLGNY